MQNRYQKSATFSCAIAVSGNIAVSTWAACLIIEFKIRVGGLSFFPSYPPTTFSCQIYIVEYLNFAWDFLNNPLQNTLASVKYLSYDFPQFGQTPWNLNGKATNVHVGILISNFSNVQKSAKNTRVRRASLGGQGVIPTMKPQKSMQNVTSTPVQSSWLYFPSLTGRAG